MRNFFKGNKLEIISNFLVIVVRNSIKISAMTAKHVNLSSIEQLLELPVDVKQYFL